MTLAIETIADSIKALVVRGATIYDYDEIPAEARSYPAIIPLVEYLTDFEMTRDSFGGGSTAKMTVEYNLHYRLLYRPVGSGMANSLKHYAGMVETAFVFLDTILAIDTLEGAVDITPFSPTNFGIVNDPAEIAFWGCDFVLHITEFVN